MKPNTSLHFQLPGIKKVVQYTVKQFISSHVSFKGTSYAETVTWEKKQHQPSPATYVNGALHSS